MKTKSKLPPKWTDIYPQGTKQGDEEQAMFIVLARHKKYTWRSVAQIAKEANLTKERVEEILAKYYKLGMVFPSLTNEDNWGYWERVPEMLPKESRSISDKDKDDRIEKFSPSASIVTGLDSGVDDVGIAYDSLGEVADKRYFAAKNFADHKLVKNFDQLIQRTVAQRVEDKKLQILMQNSQVLGIAAK